MNNVLTWLKDNKAVVFVYGVIIAAVVVGVLLVTGVLGSGSDDDGKNGSARSYATATRTSSTAMAPASVTPTPDKTTASTVCPGDHEVKANETYDVPAGCNVKGDVSVADQRLYDDDPATGLIVSCPHGCNITAPFGANVTPRTVDDLKTEMLSSGCGSKCTDVKVVVIDPTNGSSATVYNCGGELSPGETRTIPAGCIIVGDVVVNGNLQKPVGRNNNNVGYVQKLTADTTVTSPWGAGVYDSSWEVPALVQTTKLYGCDRSDGCSAGVYDWSGHRLDQ